MKLIELLNANQALNLILSDGEIKLKAPAMFKLVKFQKDNAPSIQAFQESLTTIREKHADDTEAFNAEVGELLNTEVSAIPVIKMEDIEDISISGQQMINLMPIVKE